MVFAALDYWQQGLPPPPDTEPPASGTPLFRYLVRRLIDSWHLPAGPLAYYARMAPWVASLGGLALAERRLAVGRHWPAIKASLDAGWPCPLGLVRVRSANPLLLGQNHQVLAFDYEWVGSAVRLRVYDPNQADDDDVAISVDLDPPAGRPPEPSGGPSAGPSGGPSGGPAAVLSLFPVQYAPKVPPFRS
jgi:hypothetical protein